MADYSRLSRLPVPLLEWYRANRRILPWREDPRPYRVWVISAPVKALPASRRMPKPPPER